jgi:hypothetical protein
MLLLSEAKQSAQVIFGVPDRILTFPLSKEMGLD